MEKVFNYLETFTDVNKTTKFRKFIYSIFIPFFCFLEYLSFRYFWKNIAEKEIFMSDEIVDFLDKNEFGYENNKIKKADLLSSNEFFDRFSLDEAKHIIKNDFVKTFAELIETNIAYNLEEYITLIVTTEIKFIKQNGETFREKIYTVEIFYCRLLQYQKAIKKTIWYFINIDIILGILFTIKHFHIFV